MVEVEATSGGEIAGITDAGEAEGTAAVVDCEAEIAEVAKETDGAVMARVAATGATELVGRAEGEASSGAEAAGVIDVVEAEGAVATGFEITVMAAAGSAAELVGRAEAEATSGAETAGVTDVEDGEATLGVVAAELAQLPGLVQAPWATGAAFLMLARRSVWGWRRGWDSNLGCAFDGVSAAGESVLPP